MAASSTRTDGDNPPPVQVDNFDPRRCAAERDAEDARRRTPADDHDRSPRTRRSAWMPARRPPAPPRVLPLLPRVLICARVRHRRKPRAFTSVGRVVPGRGCAVDQQSADGSQYGQTVNVGTYSAVRSVRSDARRRRRSLAGLDRQRHRRHRARGRRGSSTATPASTTPGATINVPIAATIPAGSKLYVEIVELPTANDDHKLYIGHQHVEALRVRARLRFPRAELHEPADVAVSTLHADADVRTRKRAAAHDRDRDVLIASSARCGRSRSTLVGCVLHR